MRVIFEKMTGKDAKKGFEARQKENKIPKSIHIQNNEAANRLKEIKTEIASLEDDLDWVQVDLDYASHAYKFATTDEDRQKVIDKETNDIIKKNALEIKRQHLKQEIRQIEYQSNPDNYIYLDYAS